MKTVLTKVACECYKNDEMTMQREYGKTPNGNALGGKWVLRNAKGDWIGFNVYRYDLAEANNIILKETNEHS